MSDNFSQASWPAYCAANNTLAYSIPKLK
ncbi:uncharacterized protein FRV6_16597 [Fusarium oxysporum]|uniref:Uncharacterized protein n=1 Tax=Fusarium oxysporum TaxID=5507 RepID=A0A2H3UF73_FUSOX|nr:uncharacterized protein FRV6_16597 [Fusarium oxysporum]